MNRKAVGWLVVLALLLATLYSSALVAGAQSSDQSTPTGAADATPEPSDNIWFVIGPDGQPNGSYFDVKLDAGQSTTLLAKFGNGSAIPVKALMYAADAYSAINGGFAMKDSSSVPTGPTTWLDLEPEIREFKAEEGIKKQFNVTVPENTPPGQYITGLAIETADSMEFKGDSPLRQKLRLATAVLITVPGPITPGFEISDLKVEISPAVETVGAVITNTGNIRVRPEGTLVLVDADGATMLEAPIKMGSVYAHDQAMFQVALATPLPAGTFTATVRLEEPDTGATAFLEGDVEAPILSDPLPLTIASVLVTPMPSADNVVFLQVAVTLNNTGTSVSGGTVAIQVLKDGEQVDDHILASSLTIPIGDSVVDQPYIPATGTWSAGTYTFEITLKTTDTSSGAETLVGTFYSDQTIMIP